MYNVQCSGTMSTDGKFSKKVHICYDALAWKADCINVLVQVEPPIISGNLLRHPAFRKYELCTQKEEPNVEILHKNGLYVGNSQFVDDRKVDRLLQILREVVPNV